MQFSRPAQIRVDEHAIGEQVMRDQDRKQLARDFELAEGEVLPAGAHEQYTSMAREFRAAAGR